MKCVSVTFDEEHLYTHVAPDTRCQVPVDYVTGLQRLGASRVFLVAQSSGGATTLQAFDAVHCRWLGQVIDASAGYRVQRAAVQIAPICDSRSASEVRVHCRAAQVLVANADCTGLRPDERSAFALTKKILGVGFAEQALIDARRVPKQPALGN